MLFHSASGRTGIEMLRVIWCTGWSLGILPERSPSEPLSLGHLPCTSTAFREETRPQRIVQVLGRDLIEALCSLLV